MALWMGLNITSKMGTCLQAFLMDCQQRRWTDKETHYTNLVLCASNLLLAPSPGLDWRQIGLKMPWMANVGVTGSDRNAIASGRLETASSSGKCCKSSWRRVFRLHVAQVTEKLTRSRPKIVAAWLQALPLAVCRSGPHFGSWQLMQSWVNWHSAHALMQSQNSGSMNILLVVGHSRSFLTVEMLLWQRLEWEIV